MSAPPLPTSTERAVTPAWQAPALFRATEQVEAVVRLAGGVAHDFNNLLTIIAGNAQGILEHADGGGAHRDEIRQIVDAAHRAATLTHQLLAFSRQAVLRPVPVVPGTAIAVREAELAQCAGPGIDLQLRVGVATATVQVDVDQLHHALAQLVRNAAEALPDGGTVEVAVEEVEVDEAFARRRHPMTPGPYVCVRVRDGGIGMDAVTRARALDPFFTTKGRKHGAGMGLPTVYGFVKQSGGFFWLDSTPGAGTTCEIFLPRLAALPATGSPVATVAAPGLGRGTILLVEDEDLVRQLVRRTLTRAGYEVVDVPNAHAALVEVRQRGVVPALLLTDVVMPGMDGRELATVLEHEVPGLAVILMSGFVDPRVPMPVGGGPRWFLEKPFALDRLRALVDRAHPSPPRRWQSGERPHA